MRKLSYLILVISIVVSCKKQNTSSNYNSSKEINSSDIDFFQSDNSSFKILKTEKGLNPYYVINETNYRVFRVLDSTSTKYNMTYHIAKIKTVSKMANGSEGGETKISAEIRNFNNPNKMEFLIAETEADEIEFEPNVYKVIRHGCCEDEGWIKVYNYQQILIDEGEPDIISQKYSSW